MHYRGSFRTSQIVLALTILCSCNPTCNGHENADVDFGGFDTCARGQIYNANGFNNQVGDSIDVEESVKATKLAYLCWQNPTNIRDCENTAAFFGQPPVGNAWSGPAYDGIELVYACVWVYV